jgi:hypothetical protein
MTAHRIQGLVPDSTARPALAGKWTADDIATLVALAADDDSRMAERLKYFDHVVRGDGLSATEPYFDLEFQILNASVFPNVVCVGIKDRLQFKHRAFQAKLELVGDRVPLTRGQPTTVRIRQYVQPNPDNSRRGRFR